MARVETYNRCVENPVYEGTVADASQCDLSSSININTSIVHGFGTAMVWNETNNRYEIPSAAGQLLKGVVIRQDLNEFAQDGDDRQGYPMGQRIILLKKGTVHLFMESDYDDGSPVYFRHTANGANKDVLGRFRTDADSNTCDLIRVAEVRYEESLITPSGATGTFAPVHFNLPYYSL